MELSTVPCKIGQLSDVDAKNGRVRQLFILADGKRNFGQIFSLCQIDPEEGLDLAAKMAKKGILHIDGFSTVGEEKAVDDVENIPDSDHIDVKEFVEGITSELAKYIGPVATIIMGDFTLPVTQIGIAARKDIFKKLAEEFDSQEELQEFMETAKAKQWL